MHAVKQLTTEGKHVRVVSMPCMQLFDEQSEGYKEDVLPNTVRKHNVVETAKPLGWHRFVRLDGDSIAMNHFGASAPGGTCMNEFGFTLKT